MAVTSPDRRRADEDLDALIEEARRRARRRRLGYAVAAALALMIGLGAYRIDGNGGGSGHGHAQPGGALPAAHSRSVRQVERVSSARSHGRYISSMSFSDAAHAWALLPLCTDTPCGVALDETSDGGRHWRFDRAFRSVDSQATLDRLTARVGVITGSHAFMTVDGGRHWRALGRPIEAASGGRGGPYVLTYSHGGCPSVCAPDLARLTDQGRLVPVPAFRSPSRGDGDDLAASGPDIYAIGYGHPAGGAIDQYSHVSISRDAGRSWTTIGDPCRRAGQTEWDAGQIAAAGRYLALVCTDRQTGGGPGSPRPTIALSDDAGRRFTRISQPFVDFAPEIALDARGDLAIGNGEIGGSGSWAYRLAESFDRGRRWRLALQHQGFVPISYWTPTISMFGRSLNFVTGGTTLWSSADGGADWHATPAP